MQNDLIEEIHLLKQQISELQQNFHDLSEWVQYKKPTKKAFPQKYSHLKLLEEIIAEDNRLVNLKGKRSSGSQIRYNAVQNTSASIIQAYYRGMRTRKRICEYLNQVEAAKKIQAAWRGYYTRLKLRNEKKTTIASIIESAANSGNKSLVLVLCNLLEQEIRNRKMLEEAVKTLWNSHISDYKKS